MRSKGKQELHWNLFFRCYCYFFIFWIKTVFLITSLRERKNIFIKMFALFLTAFFINFYFIQLIPVLYLLIFSLFSFNICIYCSFPAISWLCPFKYVLHRPRNLPLWLNFVYCGVSYVISKLVPTLSFKLGKICLVASGHSSCLTWKNDFTAP